MLPAWKGLMALSTWRACPGQCVGPLRLRRSCAPTASGRTACWPQPWLAASINPAFWCALPAWASTLLLATQVITEEASPGVDFLARLQCDGEAAAMQASSAGIRVVNLRIPAVLGGAAVRRNMGRMGNGKQWSSWVGRDELAAIINFIIENDSLTGPVNPVSPKPVRNAEMASTLSRVLGRKPGPSMPAFLLRIMLGEMAEALILASRRLIPGKLLAAGYQFRFPELEVALRHELEVGGEVRR